MNQTAKNIKSRNNQAKNISQVDLRVMQNTPSYLINCSYPNYNLAIEKAKVYAPEAKEVRRLDDFFTSEYETVFLSAIFSWHIPFLIQQARIALDAGKNVLIGGGATYLQRNLLRKEGLEFNYNPHPELDAVDHHFKMVYFTRGCIENCFFCPVPKIEGNIVTLNRRSHPAPLILDNNLSEIKWEYKEYIVEKYLSSDLKKVDANSGFEPKGVDAETVQLFNQLPLICWRVGFDELDEEKQWVEAIRTIKEYSKKPIRVYSMIGHETIEECRYRCEKIIEMGCEPVPQAFINDTAKKKQPYIMHDWTLEKLKHFQRFYYRAALWRGRKLEDYNQWRRISA